jgi:uncharacterized membrane protein YcaP (DUF421 family)
MEIIFRGILIYFFLFILIRIMGKRAVNSDTPFGLVLVLLISSSVADAIKDLDRSLTAGFLLAFTLIGVHFIISSIKTGNHTMTRVIDDVPTLIVRNGTVLESVMKKMHVNKEDILAAGRKQKITKIEDIKYAILEIDGSINVIPKEDE